MWPDRVSNRGPLAFESDALPTALCQEKSSRFHSAKVQSTLVGNSIVAMVTDL